MSCQQFLLLMPLAVLSAAIVLLLLIIAFCRNHLVTFAATVCGFIAALAAIAVSSAAGSEPVSTLLVMDGFARFYIGLVLAAGLITTLTAYGYLHRRKSRQEEFYLLILLASLGGCVLVSSSHFASFFLGLEILSVSLYALIAYFRLENNAAEAGIKYLVLAGVSSALLLFGIALVYAVSGSLQFTGLAEYLRLAEKGVPNILIAGVVLVMVGVGFKLALVPFHFWTPDIYEGAPAPVAGFIATASKGAIFALLLRWWTTGGLAGVPVISTLIVILAVVSMFGGNFLALMQNNVKRVLAYSSITHMGYLLIAVLVSGTAAFAAATFYLTAYFLTMLAAFTVLSALADPDRDTDTIDDLYGLAYQRPWLCGVFTVMLFSLAGIPLTAGFIAKFYLVTAGLKASLWAIIVILAINSAIGLFYYLRIVAAMYHPTEDKKTALSIPVPILTAIVLAILLLSVLCLGTCPQPTIDLINYATAF